MKAMQEIQPEVKKLQKEYKDDREEMNKQMMALYQERGRQPGCRLSAPHPADADLVCPLPSVSHQHPER